MSVYPPPQPGYGPPPPGHRPPPRNAPRGNANGVVAAAAAGVVIVVGVVTTVLLVTSDANTKVRAGVGSGSNLPSGSQRPTGPRPTGSGGNQVPTGQRPPTQAPTSAPTIPSQGGGSGNLSQATSAGNDYVEDLNAKFYYSSQGDWCQASAFPLSQDDVYSVTSAYGIGSAQGSSSVATMQGHVSLQDGRSGNLTIYLRPETSDGLTWCITSQSTLS